MIFLLAKEILSHRGLSFRKKIIAMGWSYSTSNLGERRLVRSQCVYTRQHCPVVSKSLNAPRFRSKPPASQMEAFLLLEGEFYESSYSLVSHFWFEDASKLYHGAQSEPSRIVILQEVQWYFYPFRESSISVITERKMSQGKRRRTNCYLHCRTILLVKAIRQSIAHLFGVRWFSENCRKSQTRTKGTHNH